MKMVEKVIFLLKFGEYVIIGDSRLHKELIFKISTFYENPKTLNEMNSVFIRIVWSLATLQIDINK